MHNSLSDEEICLKTNIKGLENIQNLLTLAIQA